MESDEALARRLQQEEEQEAARYARDAAYARSMVLSQQLGLTIKPQKNKKNTTKPAHHHVALPTTTHPQESTKGRRRRRGKRSEKEPEFDDTTGRAVVQHQPPQLLHQDREEDERIEQLMAILHKVRTTSHHIKEEEEEEENEYAPGELYEAVRWAFGPYFVHTASPPAHVTNCQRLVEAWRAARATASPSDQESSRRAEAAAAEFRAWLEAWEIGRLSDWEKLPLEVMEMIFAWLPTGDDLQHLLATRLVCRAWHEVTSEANQPFWRRLFVAHRQLDDPKARQHRQNGEKEARRQEYLKLLQIARKQDEAEGVGNNNNRQEEEEEEEEVCWKRRYFEVLHGVNMSDYEEYETKGFRAKLINGPRPGKSRPNYGRSSSSSSAKQRKRELERQHRRDRRSCYQARANGQGRAAKRDASW